MVKMERVIVENIIINSEIPYGYVTTFCLLNKITYTDKMMLVTRQEQYNEKER